MGNILNITNGDYAVEIMKKASISGVFLPWRDALHEGPVPDKLSLEELSKIRAQYIVESGWGLSRTAEQALKVISGGEKRPGRVFGGTQLLEERIFLGDSSFWAVLRELLASSPPLIVLPEGIKLTLPTSKEQELTITPAGLEVLAGKTNWLEISRLDRWIGGVHLETTNIWCWNSGSRSIVKKA